MDSTGGVTAFLAGLSLMRVWWASGAKRRTPKHYSQYYSLGYRRYCDRRRRLQLGQFALGGGHFRQDFVDGHSRAHFNPGFPLDFDQLAAGENNPIVKAFHLPRHIVHVDSATGDQIAECSATDQFDVLQALDNTKVIEFVLIVIVVRQLYDNLAAKLL